MASQTIFTLDAREHIFLEVLKGRFNLSSSAMHNEISILFDTMLSILSQKKINYQDLKNALIPRSDRKEIAFVFDTNMIKSSLYGYAVFSILLPLLEKESSNSVLVGDYIGQESNKEFLKSIFFENLNANKEVNYIHHGLFYIVYINNLSDSHFSKLNEGLKQFDPYVGYFNLSYSSPIKTIISTILIRLFVKYKMNIIAGTEDSEDINVPGYEFEENGYTCKGIDSLLYGLFLSYKIEREIFAGFETDTLFSINAITENVTDISDFTLLIEEKKLGYLLKEKSGSLEMAGMINLTLSELEALIKSKISNNYIYNLSFLPDSKTTKFNIMIETTKTDSNKPIRLTLALEYIATERILRLITMF